MFRMLMGLPYRDRFDFSRFRGCFNNAGGGTGGGGAGAGDGGGQGGAGAAGAGGDGGGQGQGQGGGAGKGNEPFAIFPDEAAFMARMKREGKAQMEALAKELGFESADDMKAAAKAKKETDDAAKSDLEKEKAAREKAETEKKDALAAANTRLVNAEIKVFAVQAGFVDPADAVALADRAGIQVDEQGNVTGVKEAVEALAKAKPHLVGTGKAGGSPGSAGNGSRQAGGGGDGTEFAANIAKKRTEQNKSSADHQNHYFK